MTSQVHCTHIPKIFKALTIELELSRGKQPSISISSNSSNASSYTIKSLPLKPNDKVRKITFGYIHTEVSTNEDRKPSKEDLQMHKVTLSEVNEDRRTTPHKKYKFWISIMIVLLFSIWPLDILKLILILDNGQFDIFLA